jgi:FMN-dependent NADH-azoreductase
MEMWLKFVGVTDVQPIVVEKTLFGADGEPDRAAALGAARTLARDF